jgi:lactoylglutathione lyase
LNKPFGIELGLVTENVETVIEKAITLGAILVEAPKQKPWGQTVAYIRDLDGFLIEVCTPMNG